MDNKQVALFAGGALGLGLAVGPVKRWWKKRKAEKAIEDTVQALTAQITEPLPPSNLSEDQNPLAGRMGGANPQVQAVVDSGLGFGIDLVRLAQAEGQRQGKNTTGLDQFLATIQG